MMTGKAAGTAKGSPLRQRMIDQMRIANLAESTQIAYLFEIERLAKHYGTSPADLDGEQLRDWILKLIDRGLSPSSTNSTLAAFRFFYVETLGCPERVAGLRNRKKPQALPRHMTEQEVVRRDEQDETACCLIHECSRVLGPLPHQNVPFAILNHFSRCGDRLLGRHFALFAEHHRRRFLLSPNLHPTLHRAQEPVRVLPGMCRLKPLKQLAARVPRLGLEPSVQLLWSLRRM